MHELVLLPVHRPSGSHCWQAGGQCVHSCPAQCVLQDTPSHTDACAAAEAPHSSGNPKMY
ncbi:hypothetical protein F7725_015098 [Dissostichus mawsoni]|uniref:Uncharacterized protein n=1 Tax=Dissostichus mawsoni TaxID=36200 RepID=A0A7J5YI00_DISMA|nr:hypothetical protein F7725_015098 [Dissostichus mawsoni]